MVSVVKNGRAECAKGGTRRYIGTAQLRAKLRFEANSHDAVCTLHDQQLAFKPHAIRQPRQQRRHGNVHSAAGQVCPHVRRERLPVDRNGDRGFRWEKRHLLGIYRAL